MSNPKLRPAIGPASTYEDRMMLQLHAWVRGHRVHNDIDNECCPDFSCCRPGTKMLPRRLRELFLRDPASRRAIMADIIAELAQTDPAFLVSTEFGDGVERVAFRMERNPE